MNRTPEISTEPILDFSLARSGVDDCVSLIIKWKNSSNPCRWMACFNPHSYVLSRKDTLFSTALHDADLLIPDGSGVVLASRFLGGRITERVTGSDIFLGLQKRLDQEGGYRVFFLGATDQTLEVIRDRMRTDFPNIAVAGTYAPPFKERFMENETAAMVQVVNDAQADVLWVGLSAPKQEKWIYQNRHRLNVKFAAAVGAVFDFYVGNVKRSHPFFQKIGLEWLPRLLQEPRRLWQRMFISAPIFMLHVLREMNRQRIRRRLSIR